jgi:hypothetical protein
VNFAVWCGGVVSSAAPAHLCCVANEHVRGKSTGPERDGANLFQTTFLKNRKDLAGTLAPTAGRHGHGGRQKEQGMRAAVFR